MTCAETKTCDKQWERAVKAQTARDALTRKYGVITSKVLQKKTTEVKTYKALKRNTGSAGFSVLQAAGLSVEDIAFDEMHCFSNAVQKHIIPMSMGERLPKSLAESRKEKKRQREACERYEALEAKVRSLAQEISELRGNGSEHELNIPPIEPPPDPDDDDSSSAIDVNAEVSSERPLALSRQHIQEGIAKVSFLSLHPDQPFWSLNLVPIGNV